jgi:hypothetical protein
LVVKILGPLLLSNTIQHTMVSWLKVPTPEGALLCNGYSKSILYFEEKHNLVKHMLARCSRSAYFLQHNQQRGVGNSYERSSGQETVFSSFLAIVFSEYFIQRTT